MRNSTMVRLVLLLANNLYKDGAYPTIGKCIIESCNRMDVSKEVRDAAFQKHDSDNAEFESAFLIAA
jgi:hypothetical protein